MECVFRGGICHSINRSLLIDINRYAKAKNKYLKDCDKSKELSYLKHWDVNNRYSCAMSQKLPVNCFKWVDEGFIKTYNERVKRIIFLKLIFNILKIYIMPPKQKRDFKNKSLDTELRKKVVANLHDKI